MKRIPYTVAIVAAVLSLTFSNGAAQFASPNRVGLFLTPDGLGPSGTEQIGVPVNVYLVLTRPEDGDGSPYGGVTAFDCQLNFSPAGGIFKTEENYPAGGINSGDSDNLDDGYLEFIVEFAGEVPVIDEAVMLVELQFINSHVDCVEVNLGPASVPRIPIEMSFVPGLSQPEIMSPFYGHYTGIEFGFCCDGLPVEIGSFGSVKAVFH